MKKDTKKRIGHTSQAFWNDEQNMGKPRINKENQDKHMLQIFVSFFQPSVMQG